MQRVSAALSLATRLGSGPLDHPAMAVGIASLASLVIEIDGDRLTARALDDQGAEIDRFVLIEPGVPLFADDYELGSLARWNGVGD